MKPFAAALLILLLSPFGALPQEPPAPGDEHAPPAVPTFSMRDLGALGNPYGGYSSTVGINASGLVAGSATALSSGVQNAFVWTSAGGMVNLGDLGGGYSSASALNDAGQVVGTSSTPRGEQHAFLWSAAAGMMDLGHLGGHNSNASFINASGHVAGVSTTASWQSHPFFWSPATGMVDLFGSANLQYSGLIGLSPSGNVAGNVWTSSGLQAFFWSAATGMVVLGDFGGRNTYAQAVNDSGHVIGTSYSDTGIAHAFFWSVATGMVDLANPDDTRSNAIGLNNSGQVVLTHNTPTGQSHAFLWSAATGMQQPLAEPEGGSSYVIGINDAGQVAGTTISASYLNQAAIWNADGSLHELGDLGGGYSYARYLTPSGKVLGSSYTASGEFHIFLWSSGGAMVDLGIDSNSSYPQSINDAGQVVGYSWNGNQRAWFWSAQTGRVNLNTLYRYSYSSAVAMNATGQVVGTSVTPSEETHAFFWSAAGGMVDLGTLGSNFSQPKAINNSGQVIGRSNTALHQEHAFFWSADRGMVDLSLGPNYSTAGAINASGQVAGWATTPSGYQRAFLWSAADGTMLDLGDLGGSSAYATALNDAGQVVGEAPKGDGTNHAFIWSSGTGMVDLGAPAGGYSYAMAINANGQVIGGISSGSGAFFWSADTDMLEIPHLGSGYSTPVAINDAGQVLGYSATSAGEPHAFLWSPNGAIVDLGTLGGPYSFPRAINAAGHVLGISYTPSYVVNGFLWRSSAEGMVDLGGYYSDPSSFNSSDEVVGMSNFLGQQHAFFWTASGGMLDLGTLGGPYSTALAINDDRQIVGNTTTAGGNYHAVLWQINGIPPAVVVVAPESVEATVLYGAQVFLDGSQSSDPAGLPLSYSWYLFSPFGTLLLGTSAQLDVRLPVGQNSLILVVTDSSGFTSTRPFTVTVVDTAPPELSEVPGSMTVEQAGPAGTAVQIPLPKATDLSDASPVVTSNAPAIFPYGTTTVTFFATDASGNQATATMTVTVQDTTPPSFSTSPVPAAALFAVSADQLSWDWTSRIYRFQVNAGGGAVLDQTFTDPSLATPYAAVMSPNGELLVTNIAGSVTRFANPLTDPQAVGTITQNFYQLFGAAFRNDELLVADSRQQAVFRFGFDSSGNPTSNGQFSTSPYGWGMRSMIVTPWGELLISNYSAHAIFRYVFDGNGNGQANGVIEDNIQGEPHGMAFSPSGELFVAGAMSNLIMRYRFDAEHHAIPNGQISVPGYDMVIGVAVSPWGELFAASRGKIMPDGQALISRWTFDSTGKAVPGGSFLCPNGVHELTFGPVQYTQPVPADVVLDALGAERIAYTLPLPDAFDVAGPVTVTSDAPSFFPIGTTTVTFTATDVHSRQSTATTKVTVKGRLKPTLNWGNPTDIVYGTALSGVQLNATASVPGTFTYNPPAGTVLSGGDGQLLQVVFTPTDGALYESASASATINVKKGPQTLTFPALVDRAYTNQPFAPGATASSGLTVLYSIASGPAVIVNNMVQIQGVGKITVTANQPGDGNYLPATPVSSSFTVTKASQTITFVDPPDQLYGAPPIELSASASSDLPVTLTLISGPATLAGNIVTITGVGTVKITATQSGNANYYAAPSVSQTFTVSKATQTISFGPIPDQVYGVAPFALSATSTSGLPVTFAITSGPASISGNVVTITGVGTVKIKASQAGDANYKAATAVTQQFAVTAGQKITFAAPPNQIYPVAPFALSATASSGLPVTLTVTSGPATIAGNIITVTGAGTVTVTASQAGDGGYAPAVPVTQTFTVDQGNQTITFGPLPDVLKTSPPFTVSATNSSGLPVTFAVVSGPATISGNTVTLTGGTGQVKIKASAAGNANYKDANPVTQSFKVQ
jgi:probable HAF family extracellular repeat protein